MIRWNDPELEAAERALKYRPPWMRALQVLAGLLILSAGVLFVLSMTGHFSKLERRTTVPMQGILLILGGSTNIVSGLLEIRWKRQHPEPGA